MRLVCRRDSRNKFNQTIRNQILTRIEKAFLNEDRRGARTVSSIALWRGDVLPVVCREPLSLCPCLLERLTWFFAVQTTCFLCSR